jgi:hypothetical protein
MTTWTVTQMHIFYVLYICVYIIVCATFYMYYVHTSVYIYTLQLHLSVYIHISSPLYSNLVSSTARLSSFLTVSAILETKPCLPVPVQV